MQLRRSKRYKVKDTEVFKQQLLSWSQQFEEVLWLDSNRYAQKYTSYDGILAVDAFTSIKTDYFSAFDKLEEYQKGTADWIFGYLSYDLKNATEHLVSANYDGLEFADLYFFQPKKIFLFKGNEVEFLYLRMVDDEMDFDFNEIKKITTESLEDKEAFGESQTIVPPKERSIKIKLRMTKDVYQQKVKKMLEHIHRGDIYEANFCQEFYAEDSEMNPLKTYQHLNRISRPPFATFLKVDSQYLLSATPERYLRKEGDLIISQPIKGTAKRAIDPIEDQQLARALSQDPKERSENIMIVDLVRNDLSKTATKGSVEVTEFCKVYRFEQVHQMISTITSKIANTTSAIAVLRSTFPMGSMTGAPKIAAMEIIEALEETKRGLYSGSVGYFTPEGDFDFNVIIRSILYNAQKRYISFSVGSAITAQALPEKEYEECLLKAKAMREVLEKQ